jgi:hypothetical protein
MRGRWAQSPNLFFFPFHARPGLNEPQMTCAVQGGLTEQQRPLQASKQANLTSSMPCMHHTIGGTNQSRKMTDSPPDVHGRALRNKKGYRDAHTLLIYQGNHTHAINRPRKGGDNKHDIYTITLRYNNIITDNASAPAGTRPHRL